MNDKKQLCELLRELADSLDKETVQIKEFNLIMDAGSVSGIDPENYQFETHHHDGNKSVKLNFSYYDKDSDKSNDAYNPMGDILRENHLNDQ